ncbi:phosphatidylcholine hydrolyzing phospholipase [Legionella antarctica]|uniref:Phosphatidylcholine hydrolyzing phospholipase n=1 Tax=Legionella antarctica TaxID=2708020 RepID=A0A6F8T2F8_9GAMM|nr:phospholipase [Legionella antarctica]BCA94176.1 phosphatidylcholine hydrolyzing phospholipase [Legionella antarctica]
MRTYLSLAATFNSILLLCWGLCSSPITHAYSSSGFALSEHWAIGQQIALKFDVTQPSQVAIPLHLKNGLILTFGDIISLGDLYGVLGKPISYGLDKNEKKLRFKEAFKTFAKSFAAVGEVTELTLVIQNEIREIEASIEKGETAEEIYKRLGNEIGRQVNCITGGGCTTYGWWLYPGRYLLLAMENYDHFSPNDINAYKAGHQVALQQALKAQKTGDRSDLEIAYAMEAFAAHYLSDHFAAGHLRTPRGELKNKVSPAVLGSLLASYMHNEENKYGLHVHNALGDHWIVYGDFSYFNPMNQLNQQMLLKTLQQSADEVFDAYNSGAIPEQSRVLEMLPQVDLLTDENNLDITPMFFWDDVNKQLYRRTDLSNPYDKKVTSSWWGWSTLVLLKNHYGITSTIQLSLTKYLSQFKPEEFDNSPIV